MQLTDKQLKAFAATGKRYEFADGLGLSVRVSPTGKINFQYRYRFRGKPCRLDLGTYPLTSLSEARDRHHAARKLLDQGQDPVEAKRQTEREEQAAWTVQDLAKDFLVRKVSREWKCPEYAEYLLNRNVLPGLGHRKVKDVTTREVMTELEKIADRGARVLANRTASLTKQMFAYAVQKGLREDNPCMVITKASVGGRERPRTRFLSYSEVWRLWRGLDASSIAPWMKLAAKILLVTGQRRGELMLAQWADIDFDRGAWFIPAERSKNGKAHTVPLSSMATDLLLRLKAYSGTRRYLFPSPILKPEQPSDIRALNKALRHVTKKLSLKQCSPHVLRHTFTTLVSGLGVAPHVIEKILNHSLGGVLAVYNHHEFMPERKAALQAWADRLTVLLNADSVHEVRALETVWTARADGLASNTLDVESVASV
jgi:integrase